MPRLFGMSGSMIFDTYKVDVLMTRHDCVISEPEHSFRNSSQAESIQVEVPDQTGPLS